MRISLLMTLLLVAPAAGQDATWLDDMSRFSDPGGTSVFKKSPGGVRITSPVNAWTSLLGTRPLMLRTLESVFALGGEFEIHADFQVHAFGTADAPPKQECNAELALLGRGTVGTYAINVGFRPERGPCFNVFHGHSHAGGFHFNMLTFPRTANVGKLSIQRQGGEVVFLAADGADAPLGELVRLPIRPDVTPGFKFSVYHGNGANPSTIDVSFTNLILRAEKQIRGPEADALPTIPAPKTTYPVQLDYTRTPARLMTDFKASRQHDAAFKMDGDALRIHPPVQPAYRKDAPSYFMRESRFALEGDFEISWTYKLHAVGPFGKEGAGRASFGIGLQNDSPLGVRIFSLGGARETPRRFGVTAEIPSKKGLHYDTQAIAAPVDEGRMILQRVGSELIYSVQDRDGPPRVLSRQPFTAARIPKLRISAYQGSNCTNVLDASIRDFTIKADRIIDAQTDTVLGSETPSADGTTTVIESFPEVASRKWRFLKYGLVGFGVIGLMCGAWLVWRSRKRRISS